MARHSRDPPGSDRGQLYLDYVVGIGIFMLAIAFVLSFGPGMFGTFADEPDRPLVADRSVDRLAGPMLGAETRPSTLNATCTAAFFHQSGTTCGVDTTGSISEQVGIRATYSLNVTLSRPVSNDGEHTVLCIDGDSVVPCQGGLSRATVGPPAPTTQASVTTAYRTVYVDGRDATLVVRVW